MALEALSKNQTIDVGVQEYEQTGFFIARENLKLADLFLRSGQKRALKGEMAKAQQQQESNSKAQQEAAINIQKEKQATLQMEAQTKSTIEMALSQNRQKEVILQGIFGIFQKGTPMPEELKELSNEIIKNVGMPLFAQNQQIQQQLEQQSEDAMKGQEQPQEQQGEQPQQEGSPQDQQQDQQASPEQQQQMQQAQMQQQGQPMQ